MRIRRARRDSIWLTGSWPGQHGDTLPSHVTTTLRLVRRTFRRGPLQGAAIRSWARPKGKSGAYLLKNIAQKTQELRSQGLPTEIRWVPAHTGIQGNEDADRAAKEAAGWRDNGRTGPTAEQPPELFSLQSTLQTDVGTQGGQKSMAGKMGTRNERQNLLPSYTKANQKDPSAP